MFPRSYDEYASFALLNFTTAADHRLHALQVHHQQPGAARGQRFRLAAKLPPLSARWPGPYGPGSCAASSHHQWRLANFTSLVVFGDSYTDDSRLGYFINNHGAAPPVGYNDPVSYHAADGGRVWVEYVKQYTGANLYNYAVSGAVCSNEITPRWFSAINAPFPDIAGYELPAYLNDSALVYANGTKFMTDPPDATVYAMWIGTNDLGYSALIQDEQVAGTNLTTYVDCVYDQLDRVYANGGRFFVLLNVAPLNLAPEYGILGQGGAGPNQYWEDKSGNISEISGRMLEEVVSANAIYQYRTPYEVVLANRYPGADFALYNVHDLVRLPRSLVYLDDVSLTFASLHRCKTSTTTPPPISTAPRP